MRSATIVIPTPCTQSWANMAPNTVGRHCAACQETVADFTHLTDSEVVTFLREYPRISCGRFRESQLSRPLLAAAQPVTGWRRWLGTTVALLGIGSVLAPKAQGQAKQASYAGGPEPIAAPDQSTHTDVGATGLAPVPTSRKANKAASKPEAAASDDSVISGVIRNRLGWPLKRVGVRIYYLNGKSTGVLTDGRGHFEIHIPPGLRVTDNMLHIRKVGFAARHETIDVTRPTKLHYFLKKQEMVWAGKFR